MRNRPLSSKEIIIMAKKGDWVRIHATVLKADERTAKLPADTQKCDLEMWTKGFLQEDAESATKLRLRPLWAVWKRAF